MTAMPEKIYARPEPIRADLVDTTVRDGYPDHPPCLECGAMAEDDARTRCKCGGS